MKKKSNLKGIISEYKDIVIVVGILVIIVLVCAIVFNIVSKKEEGNTEEEIVTTTLTLFGNRTINLEVGEDFEEPGYYAIDSNGVLQTSNIIITNNVDTTKPGTYEIIYRIADKEEIRTVIVEGEEIKEPVTSEKKPLTLTLTGEKVINLSLGETYTEPGYKATDSNGLDATEKVLVLGEVDTSKVGNYTLTYVLEDGEDKKEVIRTIVVLDDKLTITLTPNTTSYASSITLNIKVTGNNFASLTLPNQNIVKSASNNYNITSNGTYTVTAYNKNGGKFEKSITITNIDKTAPTGTCQVTINDNNTTTFNIIASDNESGINNYVYYDDGKQFLNTTTGSYVYQKETSLNVYVKVYDKAKNEKFIYCDVTDNSEPSRVDNPIILIGDSRTVGMCTSCKLCSGNKVVAKGGMSYSWLKNTAIGTVNSYLKKNPDKSYNIFILLGVNGIGSSASSGKSTSNTYFKKVQELATNEWKDHYIYYVSVNPVAKTSTNNAVKAFNSNMKSKINDANIRNLKYCDTYSKVKINSTTTYQDGVHYKCKGYKTIYNTLKTCPE